MDRRYHWLTSIQHDEDVAISGFTVAELYGLLRNPAVLLSPLGDPPGDPTTSIIKNLAGGPLVPGLTRAALETANNHSDAGRVARAGSGQDAMAASLELHEPGP